MCFLDLNCKTGLKTCSQKDHSFTFTDLWIQIITRKLDISWFVSNKTIDCYVAKTSYLGNSFKGPGKSYYIPWFEPDLLNIKLSIDKIQKLLVFT